MTSPAEHPALAWAASGAMSLTGRAAGPPLLAPGDPAGAVRRALNRIAAHGVRAVPGPELLSERAALSGVTRDAPWSAGHAFRGLPTRDGWLGLSLSRDSDLDLLPALIEDEVGMAPWEAVARWARRSTTASAEARTVLLGLAAAPIPSRPPAPSRPGVVVTRFGARRRQQRPPRVLDLTALWAGPLCARLLGLGGAEILTVESAARPDGARLGAPEFYARLHDGRQPRKIDFHDGGTLSGLIASADVVLEASRPRALRQLGIDAEEVAASGKIWLSITARGRSEPLRVGFGDDVAAGAGLVAWDDGLPCPVGDAIADPLTGVAAAAAVFDALAEDEGCLIDVSMRDVCVEAALADPGTPARVVKAADGWVVEADHLVMPVLAPGSGR
ncbi:CoA transferase [Jatrophihabitans sp.]|uniref:CoA transferase n=1 Tax=Jatrophihabitans sp. TaxID=1932789 RepID=UPI0030C68A26|nr:hypothetical protein [Jatrophihabitans sp.]